MPRDHIWAAAEAQPNWTDSTGCVFKSILDPMIKKSITMKLGHYAQPSAQ